MRSFWKGPTLFTISLHKKENIEILSRESVIFPCFINKTFLIKTGKSSLKKVRISAEMVGLKIGEFAFSKKIY